MIVNRSTNGRFATQVVLLQPRRVWDERGWFEETYSRRTLAEVGIDVEFVQDNHSLSRPAGVMRGLHFQCPPRAQAKLVRCIRGRMYDVVVDIRRGSPTYGRHLAVELSAQNGLQLFVPAGFAHGFVTLEPGCEVAYKVSDFYDPSYDRGIRCDDPSLEISWPIPTGQMIRSSKDRALPSIAVLDSPFLYEGEPLPDSLS